MKKTLLAVVALGAALRFWAALSGSPRAPLPADPQEGYFAAGLNWVDAGVFTPDAATLYPQPFRGPLYPAFLGLAQSFGGVRAAALAQAALSTAGIAAAYGLAAGLSGPAAGLLAAGLTAFDPSCADAARFDLHLFYGLLALALAWAAGLWLRKPGDGASALFGLLLGASFLCRSAHVLSLPLLAAASRRPRPLALAFGAALLALAPYVLRNRLQFGRAGLDAGWGAYSLYAAAAGVDHTAPVDLVRALAEKAEPGFAARHRGMPEEQAALAALAWREALARPGDWLLGVPRRLWRLWGPVLPGLLLALVFLWKARRSPEALGAGAVLLSFSGYAGIAVQPRYVDAARPLLWTLAACGAVCLLKKEKPAPEPRPARALAAVFAGVYALSLALFTREAWLFGWPSDRAKLAAAAAGLSTPAGRAKTLVGEGMVLYAAKDFKGAEASFRGALEAAPGDLQAAMSLASLLKELGRAAEAREALDKALFHARGDALEGKARELRAELKRPR